MNLNINTTLNIDVDTQVILVGSRQDIDAASVGLSLFVAAVWWA